MRKSSRPDPTLEAVVKQVMAEEAAEQKAAFHLRLRSKGVQDLAVLRAFERVDRHAFVPHRYLDLAPRDIALPIGCGQTMDEPWLMARMIEALRIGPEHRVLEIGTGSGYATAALSHLARDVVSVDRYKGLAAAAEERLAALGLANVRVLHADGLALPPDLGPFDRILVNGLLRLPPDHLGSHLATGGLCVCARPSGGGQVIMRHTRAAGVTMSDEIVLEVVNACGLGAIEAGLAATL